MIDPFQTAIRTAGSALEAQSLRIRVVSENLANAQTTGAAPGEEPYARKTISFADEMSRVDGARRVRVRAIGVDPAPFRIVRDPGHPAADDKGNVKTSNVDPMIELADLKEANHSYEANLQTIKQSRDLLAMTVDLLKS
jgi:flagellar basal-body rod protein FlgC